MDKARGVTGFALLGIVIALLGCGGSTGITPCAGKSDRASPVAGLAKFPAPTVLRQASTISPGVFRYGSQYANALPSQLVAPGGNTLQFTPDWSEAGLNGAAYAIYGFNCTGYTTDDMLHLAWRTSGATSGNLWLGLANFVRDRWDWFTAPTNGTLPYDATIYTDNNLLYAMVLCLGSEPWSLASISISADVQPVVLSINPPYSTQGVPTVFTAVVQGTVDSYSWNFGGGAVPNASTACAPEVIPAATGIYPAALTIANDFGQDVFNFSLQVGKPSVILSLTNPPAAGAGTKTDPYRASVAIEYLFHLNDSVAGDVTLSINSHYHVSDEVGVGTISNLDALLNIKDDFTGTFFVTADYPDAAHTAHPILYFTVNAPVPELEIYPDSADPDWSAATGTGTQTDPYILDAADLTRVYSLLADDKIGAGGNPVPVTLLTWKAVPAIIATWMNPGEFRAELFANGYIYSLNDGLPVVDSNKIYIKLY